MKRNLFYYFFLRFFTPLGRLIFWVRYQGLNNIPEQGKLIVCSNHKSVFDPFLVAIPFRRQIHYMAKNELFTEHGALACWFLNRMGAFPVKRNTGDLNSIKTAERILNDEEIVGIFPQGGCVFDNSPFRPKAGAALLAAKTGAPVLPASIYCKGLLRPFKRITIRFGDAILENRSLKHNSAEIKAFAEKIADRINLMLEEKY